MPQRLKIVANYIVLFVVLGTTTTSAQLLQDSTSLNLLKRDIDCIYNQQFTEAREISLKLEKSNPGHPVIYRSCLKLS